MTTLVKIGPAEHGRPMTLGELEASELAEGHRYELIDGRLYVSPAANAPEGFLETWALRKLMRYAEDYPAVINHACGNARVFVPNQADVTNPQPDVAAYHDFPRPIDLRDLRWQDVSPVLVAEVLSADNPQKDLTRNADLYHQVPSIKEYWVIDGRDDPNRPTMTVHRRYGRRWRLIHVQPGETYATRLLPGFELVLDPWS